MADGKQHPTELEGVILGIVASRQPCSSYTIRQRFERTPTWGWSTSKGAIYPAVARLVARGMLNAEPMKGSKRRVDLLTVSQSGRLALVNWLLNITRGMGSAPVDPIRARANYLANLAPHQRVEFVERALAETRQAFATAETAVPDPCAGDAWALELTYLGARRQIEAKLRWLEDLRTIVTRAPSESRSSAPRGQPEDRRPRDA